MDKLSLVAIVIAKENKKDFIEKEIQKLSPITRKESGCLNYNLFIDNKNPNRFVLEENWESYDAWQAHMNNAHMTNYSEVTKDAVESWELIELTQID